MFRIEIQASGRLQSVPPDPTAPARRAPQIGKLTGAFHVRGPRGEICHHPNQEQDEIN